MKFKVVNKLNDIRCPLCEGRINGKGLMEVVSIYHNNFCCLKCGTELIKTEIREGIELMREIIDARKQEIFDKKFKEIKNRMLDDCLRALREE